MVNRKIIYASLTAVILSVLITEFVNNTKPKHPHSSLNTIELIEQFGYPAEVHQVTTDDGYILTLHRIPSRRKKKNPVLFMHGFMQSAIDFVHLGPSKALTLLLADQGYDIWLGNARGSTWSRKHQVLDPDKNQFWNFSLHEIGVYDVSAFIDHVLNTTDQRALQYVGFSQGTIAFFILMSERPEYAEKVKLMTALAPAIFLKNPPSPFLQACVLFRKPMEFLLDTFNIREFLSHNSIISRFTKQICNEHSMFVNLCLHQFFMVHGYNFEGANKTRLSLIYSNTPAGVASKQMMHIIQMMEVGEFRQYDFGVSGNLEQYGEQDPPAYNLSRATSPVALYYTSNDWIVNIQNIERIVRELPNVVKNEKVNSEKFNHDDFVHSDEAADLVYRSIIKEMLMY